ncbi:hypothetical protein ACNUDN_07940 [Mycobacterium sp. smrl_JER01]|uniref:hypothetical protein n=1 Tax=Mycobacterium sp. smrl_JER01 TaxID=3402633 RepID=UPI003ACCABF5
MELDDQVEGIKATAARFDQGTSALAWELAQQLRILLHDGAATPSLITRAGLGQLTWVDTAGVPNPKTLCSIAGLTLMRIRSRHHGAEEYVPKLAMYPPVPIRTRSGDHIFSGSRIPFEEWWTNPVVMDACGTLYSRKQLVLALAGEGDPEGDLEVDAAHRALAGSASLGWVVRGESSRQLCGSPVVASIRQIGYETLRSITEQRDIIDAAA